MRARAGDRRPPPALVLGFAGLCLAVLALALAPGLDRPGVYYDELSQVEPALQFLEGDGVPHEFPGASRTRLLGRWFPLTTQPYMGALKSWALMPVFAIFGASPATLRLTTLAWSLAGLGLLMVWARRQLGLPVALAAGALVALDPSFLFVSRHDWGSVALAFLFRCGALLLWSSGFRAPAGERAGGRMFAGGLLLGLGLCNKLDFAAFLVGAGLALLLARPSLIRELRTPPRWRPLWGFAGLVSGATPLLASLGTTLATARRALARQASGAAGDDWAEKWSTFAGLLDGSYFHELMLAGGHFQRMLEIDGARSPFALLFAASAAYLGARLLFGERGTRAPRVHTFVLLAALLVPLAVFAIPRAVRIHHAMTVLPFPQLVVAAAAGELWRSRRRTAHVAAAVGIFLALAGSLRVDLRIVDTIRETGGRGRWSAAIGDLAPQLRGATAVSLDWGFHLPLRFADRDLTLVEPIWRLRAAARRPRTEPWTLAGTPRHVYLLFPPRFAVFDFGTGFLDAVSELPPGQVTLRDHRDAAGGLAFRSVRIHAPHRLRYRRRFDVTLTGPPEPASAAGPADG